MHSRFNPFIQVFYFYGAVTAERLDHGDIGFNPFIQVFYFYVMENVLIMLYGV